MLESKLNLMVSKVPFMAERSDPEREVLRQLGSLCFTRRGPVSPLGGGQSPVHVGSMTRDFLAGIPGQAGPEACRGPRPAGPGEKAGQGRTRLPATIFLPRGGGRGRLPFSVPSPSRCAFSMSLQSVIWRGGQKGSYQRQPEI